MTKYHAVRDELLDRLETMSAGEQLPAERELAAQMGVSRMTLRRAIDELVTQGLVRRRHGAGVFALRPKLDQSLAARSFTQDMLERGLRPGSVTVDFHQAEAGARIAARLGVDPEEPVHRITRLRLADDEPLAIEELAVPVRVVPDLAPEDLSNASFYELLRTRAGLRIGRSSQTIEPTLVDETEAEQLTVPAHTPALLFERTSWAVGGQPLEFVRSVYRGDRYKVRTELSLDPAPRAETGSEPC